MAQHIEIRKLPQKIFQRIAKGIELDAKSPYIGGSLKYEKNNSYGTLYPYRVYNTTRYIGKGFVYGNTRGFFEVHIARGRAVHIFLVA